MSSSWARSFGNVRSFVGNALGGLRGGSNLASWAVAGTLAYFLWVKPSRDLKREQEEPAMCSSLNTCLPKSLMHEIVTEEQQQYNQNRSQSRNPVD